MTPEEHTQKLNTLLKLFGAGKLTFKAVGYMPWLDLNYKGVEEGVTVNNLDDAELWIHNFLNDVEQPEYLGVRRYRIDKRQEG